MPMNFTKKYNDNDLNKLLIIANEQGKQINISLIMITLKPLEEDLQKITTYFEEKGIEVLLNDVEPDVDDNNAVPVSNIIQPFDPSKINILMDKMTMDSIIKRIKNKELEFNTDFQRKAGLWNNTQKSQLIESLLLSIPLPAFYFDATDDDKWLIIDGLQRITTIKEFAVDRAMCLQGMEFLKELDGKKYDGLPRSLQRRIEETNVNAYLVKPSTPANVKFNIFKRINTGGLTLEPQEIRNALFQGVATKFLNELAQLPAFTKATDGSIKKDRMLDREFCLRYVAFSYLSINDYNASIDDFLNNSMIYLNKRSEDELKRIKDDYINVLLASYEIFGKHAFRKMAEDGYRRPINKVLFETWTHLLHSKDSEVIQKLICRKKQVIKQFIQLCDQKAFLNALKASDKNSMNARIKSVDNILSFVLKD